MKYKFICAVLLILIGFPITAYAKDDKTPLTLKPTTKWQIDYANERCRLFRKFGSGDDAVFAIFDRYGLEDNFKLSLAGKPLKTWNDAFETNIQFGPDEKEQKIEFIKGDLNKLPAILFGKKIRFSPKTEAEELGTKKADYDESYPLAPISDERMSAIQYLDLGKALRQPVRLELGEMRKPNAALKTCVEDLVKSWGVVT